MDTTEQQKLLDELSEPIDSAFTDPKPKIPEQPKKEIKKQKFFVKAPKDGKALFFKIPSSTTQGIEYDVRVMASGEVRCSCTANVYGMKCIHITTFLKTYNEDQEKLLNEVKRENLEETKEEIVKEKKEKKPEKPVPTTKSSGGFGSEFPF